MKTLTALFLLTFLNAGQITITGKVLATDTEKPVIGANVQIVGTDFGSATDLEGRFSIAANLEFPLSIKVSHISYMTLEIVVPSPDPVVVSLDPVVLQGQAVEVTGTRPLYKADVAAAVDLIDLTAIEVQGAREVGSALRRITSINIDYSNTGKQTITIRGSNPEDVAVYLDGVKINQANTGIADLSMIDINTLSEIQVIKGGNTTLFGAGNTGGILNLESRKVTKNSLSVVQGNGLTFENDVDFSISGTGKFHALGVGARYSGSNRAYAGRTITTAIFKNVFSDVFLPQGYFGVKWYNLEKALTFPSGGVALSDAMELVSVKYAGNLPYTGKWEFFYGNRHWVNDQDFMTSLREYITDDTETYKISKLFGFRSIESTIQFEQERQDFNGEKNQLDIDGNAVANRNSRLTRRTTGLSTANRLVFAGDSPAFSEIRFEAGLRYDFVEIVQTDQFEFFLDPGNDHPTVYYKPEFYRYSDNSTRRLGMQVSGYSEKWRYTLFLNQGSNLRNPTLRDYFRFAYMPEETQMDSTLGVEYLHTTEANGKFTLQNLDLNLPIENIDIEAGFFRNDYVDKIAYRFAAENTPIPYNAREAAINGLEGSLKFHFPEDIFVCSVGATHLNISSAVIFPNRARNTTTITAEFHKKWLTVSYDQINHGKRYVYIPGIGEGFRAPSSDANITFSVHKTLHKMNWFLNYSIRNLYAKKYTGDQDALRDFNYFNQFRQILTLRVDL